MIRPARLLAPLAAAAALAAVPSIASAADFCVADQACVDGGGTLLGDVQTALNTAWSTPGNDRVLIGPGDFSTAGYYSYNTNSSTNFVQIIGAGRYRTRLSSTTTTGYSYTLRLLGGPQSSVRDLTVAAPSPIAGKQLEALELTGGAQNVGIEGSVGSSLVLVRLDGDNALLDHVHVNQDGGGTDTSIAVGGGTAASITDTTIEDPGGTGVYLEPKADVHVSRLTFHGWRGMIANNGSTLKVDNSLLDIAGFQSSGIEVVDGTTASVDHVTIAGPGNALEGVRSQTTLPGPTTNLAVRDSVITGFPHSVARYGVTGGPANATLEYSDFDPASVNQTGDGTVAASTGDVNVAPGFRDAANGDFELRSDSPLVDAGDPAGLSPGESDTDLASAQRLVGRTDIGAFELQPAPPAPAPQGGGSPPPAGSSGRPASAAPRIALAGRRVQHIAKHGAIVVRLSADQHVSVRARTVVRLRGVRRALALKAVSVTRDAGTSRLRLQLGRKRTRQVLRALKSKRRVTARVRVEARNGAGLTSSAARAVRLVR